MSLTYAELTQAIQDFTEYSETSFVANIPNFVRMAEERISRSVMIPELRKNATSTLTAASPYLVRPDDFLAAFSLAVIDGSGSYSFLLDKDVNFIREAFPSVSDQGLPKYYAQFDGDDAAAEGHFILGPTPDQNYTVELHYYYDPPSIITTGTSWFGENAETALLYGSLVEASVYMKGDPALTQLYEQKFKEALSQIGGVGIRSMRDNYRNGEILRG